MRWLEWLIGVTASSILWDPVNSCEGEPVNYELFISYSRKDNHPLPGDEFGWVTALHEEILKDHKRFST